MGAPRLRGGIEKALDPPYPVGVTGLTLVLCGGDHRRLCFAPIYTTYKGNELIDLLAMIVWFWAATSSGRRAGCLIPCPEPGQKGLVLRYLLLE